MSYNVEIRRPAKKEWAGLQKKIQLRIRGCLLSLKKAPYKNVKKLKDGSGFRAKVGDYRILYNIDAESKTVIVWRIRHRKDAYNKN